VPILLFRRQRCVAGLKELHGVGRHRQTGGDGLLSVLLELLPQRLVVRFQEQQPGAMERDGEPVVSRSGLGDLRSMPFGVGSKSFGRRAKLEREFVVIDRRC